MIIDDSFFEVEKWAKRREQKIGHWLYLLTFQVNIIKTIILLLVIFLGITWFPLTLCWSLFSFIDVWVITYFPLESLKKYMKYSFISHPDLMIKMLSVNKQIFFPGFSCMHKCMCAYGCYVPSSAPSKR